MIDDGYLAILALRLIGGLGGSLIAIVVVQPDTPFGLLKRLSASLLSAGFLTPKLAGYLGWGDDPDSVMAAACIVSAIAWWVWHSLIRLFQSGWLPGVGKRE